MGFNSGFKGLITVTCNIRMAVVTASPGNVQTIPRNHARKKK